MRWSFIHFDSCNRRLPNQIGWKCLFLIVKKRFSNFVFRFDFAATSFFFFDNPLLTFRLFGRGQRGSFSGIASTDRIFGINSEKILMVLLKARDHVCGRGQRVGTRAIWPDVSGRCRPVKLPLGHGIIPNLDFVLGDRRSAVINGEQPIQSHRIFHLFQNTNAQWLSRGLWFAKCYGMRVRVSFVFFFLWLNECKKRQSGITIVTDILRHNTFVQSLANTWIKWLLYILLRRWF